MEILADPGGPAINKVLGFVKIYLKLDGGLCGILSRSRIYKDGARRRTHVGVPLSQRERRGESDGSVLTLNQFLLA